MKTILLIGSSGFIGTHLRNELRKDYKLLCPKNKKYFDIRDFKKVYNFINKKKIDVIINLSGQISTKKEMFETIIQGNQNIINSFKDDKKLPLILYLSSSLVYGYSNKPLNENSKLFPLTNYAKMKRIAENQYLKTKLNFKILRIANVYDQYKNGIIKILISSLNSNRKVIIPNINSYNNFIHISDLVRVIKKILKIKLNYNIYNIGNENINLKNLIKLVEKRFRKKLSFRDKKIKIKLCSSQKLNKFKLFKEINMEPKILLENFFKK